MDASGLNQFATQYTVAWNSQNAESVAAHYAENGSLKINDDAPSTVLAETGFEIVGVYGD